MRTPYIVTILVDKADVEVANKTLADLGFGEGNFGIDCDSQFIFCAPLQKWQYDKIVDALNKSGITYKLSEYPNDGNVKEKIEDTLDKEGLTIKKVIDGN